MAAKDEASQAASSCEVQKAAATEASTAAAAAAGREAVLKQSLHDAEERSVAMSSQLGASQRRASSSHAVIHAVLISARCFGKPACRILDVWFHAECSSP
jgi:hypothetical protein